MPRAWRLTHKLLGIPFAFASLHLFTAEKPYANGSAWGWWFGTFMVAGLVAYVARVLVRDVALRGVQYKLVSALQTNTTTTLELEPVGKPLAYRAGQFAFIKVQARGMSEPHAFTIASSPLSGRLRFVIRELGDWTHRLREMELVGVAVIVEGRYGEFKPTPATAAQTVWVAGGVRITPFLAALDGLESAPEATRPHLFYAVRSRENASAIETLEEAEADGRLSLTVCESGSGDQLTKERFWSAFPDGLNGAHAAMCGPAGLVSSLADVARSLGAADVETEDFDIRQGFGPDLSRDIDDGVRALGSRRR